MSLSADQEREALAIAERTGWHIDQVRELIAIGANGDPGCIRPAGVAEPDVVAMTVLDPERVDWSQYDAAAVQHAEDIGVEAARREAERRGLLPP